MYSLHPVVGFEQKEFFKKENFRDATKIYVLKYVTLL